MPSSGRTLFSIGLAVVFLGLGDAMAKSYLVLFGADEAHLSPVRIGLLATASGLAGIAVSTWLGRRFDRRPTRAYVIVVALLGALGFVLLSFTRSFIPLLLLSLTLLGATAAVFPQLFSLARVALGDSRSGQRSAPLLRAAWSLAWAVGPLLGAAVLAWRGYAELFLATAALMVVTAVVTLNVPHPGPGPETAAAERPQTAEKPGTRLLAVSVMLFFASMIGGSLALPLFITRDLDLPATWVGVLLSVCAAVEIVATLILAALPEGTSQRWLIAGAMVLMAIHFPFMLLVDNSAGLVVGQFGRGIAIAFVGGAGIRYFQDVMAPATAQATTLFSNAYTAGSLVAGTVSGVSLEVLGPRPTLLLSGAVALGSAAFFLAARPGSRSSLLAEARS